MNGNSIWGTLLNHFVFLFYLILLFLAHLYLKEGGRLRIFKDVFIESFAKPPYMVINNENFEKPTTIYYLEKICSVSVDINFII
ncbi:MAG: hypothetical protein MASP_00395 [Candidatus Methanolliviera sp. GoM_asphalt]|nr:MAG: hypothetical protein MASP_00395 [Candidatus Methanolliviera sp. GoM_asphalt]